MIKNGNKTTEFGLIIAYILLILANGTEYVNIPWQEMASLGAAIFGYCTSRGLAKLKAGNEQS